MGHGDLGLTGTVGQWAAEVVDPAEYRKALVELHARMPGEPSVEGVSAELKLKGFSQVDCIRAVVELGLCTQAAAKRTVHHSAAWSSTREQSEKLHAEVEAALIDDFARPAG